MKLLEFFKGKDLSDPRVFKTAVNQIVASVTKVGVESELETSASDITEFLALPQGEASEDERNVVFESLKQFAKSKNEVQRDLATEVLVSKDDDDGLNACLSAFTFSKNKYEQLIAAKVFATLKQNAVSDSRLTNFLNLPSLEKPDSGLYAEYLFQLFQLSESDGKEQAEEWLNHAVKNNALLVFLALPRLMQQDSSSFSPESIAEWFPIALKDNPHVKDKLIDFAKGKNEQQRQVAAIVFANWLCDPDCTFGLIVRNLANGGKNSCLVLQQVMESVLSTENSYRVIGIFLLLHESETIFNEFLSVFTKKRKKKELFTQALINAVQKPEQQESATKLLLLLWRYEKARDKKETNEVGKKRISTHGFVVIPDMNSWLAQQVDDFDVDREFLTDALVQSFLNPSSKYKTFELFKKPSESHEKVRYIFIEALERLIRDHYQASKLFINDILKAYVVADLKEYVVQLFCNLLSKNEVKNAWGHLEHCLHVQDGELIVANTLAELTKRKNTLAKAALEDCVQSNKAYKRAVAARALYSHREQFWAQQFLKKVRSFNANDNEIDVAYRVLFLKIDNQEDDPLLSADAAQFLNKNDTARNALFKKLQAASVSNTSGKNLAFNALLWFANRKKFDEDVVKGALNVLALLEERNKAQFEFLLKRAEKSLTRSFMVNRIVHTEAEKMVPCFWDFSLNDSDRKLLFQDVVESGFLSIEDLSNFVSALLTPKEFFTKFLKDESDSSVVFDVISQC